MRVVGNRLATRFITSYIKEEKSMRIRLIALFLCAFLLASCAPAAQPTDALAPQNDDSLLLGYSQLGSESNWRIGNTRSIQQAAQSSGVQLMFDNAEQKQEKQIKAIRSFIAYQVDVIAFSPIVEDGWDNVLIEAKEAGIPVLLVDRSIKTSDDSLYAGFIGSDFLSEGRKAGEFLLERTRDMDEVNIVEITGTVDSTPMRQRSEGFRDAIRGNEKYQIIASVTGDFMRSKGKESMEKLLLYYHNINVLYTHNDQMTLGAIEAIEAVGLKPGKDIIVISVDGEQEAVDLLKQGKINCIVECTPNLGPTVIRLAQTLASGGSIDRVTYSDETVFSEYDDVSAIAPRGY